MYFQREPLRVLPNGETAIVSPFHVSTEGLEDRVIFRDEEDLRVAHNLIPISAKRANVIIIADCELNTHIHSGILARSEEDACKFILGYKISVSKYLTSRYGSGMPLNSFRRTDSRPVPLLDNFHLRNALCYIPRNALDVGEKPDQYRWSSYRAMFSKGLFPGAVHPISSMTYREKRTVFKTDGIAVDPSWMVTLDGVIEPVSYCDIEYAEGAFNNDIGFFLKIMGLVDDQQMEQELVVSPNRMKKVGELINIIDDHSRRLYSKPSCSLSFAQKIPIIKTVWRTNRTSVAQLARCFALTKKEILFALGKD